MVDKGKILEPFPIIDFETEPPQPSELPIEFILQQALAWLVGFDGVSRRLIRTDINGNLSTAPPYAQFRETTVLYITSVVGAWRDFTTMVDNQMITLMVGSQAQQFKIFRVATGDSYQVVIPRYDIMHICHPVAKCQVQPFPLAGGAITTCALTMWY